LIISIRLLLSIILNFDHSVKGTLRLDGRILYNHDVDIKKNFMADRKTFVTKLKDLSSPTFDASVGGQSTDHQATDDQNWLDGENFDGQLAVDVYQTAKDIVIKSTIAGVRPEDIDIAINNDMVTIKGYRRQDDTVDDDQYFYRECYWGGFSRSIILPVDIIEDRVRASLKNGVLTIVLPKAGKAKVQVIPVADEDEAE